MHSNLNTRERGPYFAPFEKEMVFNSENKHRGWVRWITKDAFVLDKSPFYRSNGKNIYLIPLGQSAPLENQPIELEVMRLKREMKQVKNSTYFDIIKVYYLVENWKPFKLDLSNFKLKIDYKDFLYKVSSEWKHAELDHLDWMLGLQAVSCPDTSLYGKGGLGVQSLNLFDGTKRPLDSIHTSLKKIIPNDFFGISTPLSYTFLKTESDLSDLNMRYIRPKISEVNYNYLYFFETNQELKPINIPTIIQNARYRNSKWEMPPEILQYQITAYMLKPVIPEKFITEIEKSIETINKVVLDNPPPQGLIEFNRLSIVKLAESISRLHLKDKLDEHTFRKAVDIFLEQYKELIESQAALKAVREKRTYDVPYAHTSYARQNLSNIDIQVFMAVVKLYDELHDFIGLEKIQEKVKFNRSTLLESLENLQTYGYILASHNFTLFKPIQEVHDF